MNCLGSSTGKGMRSSWDKFKRMFLWYYWTAGPPDVEQPCDPSLQAWSPELSLYDTNLTSPCPDTEGCTLTLHFLHPLVPHSLTLWVTYMSSSKCHSVYLKSVLAVGQVGLFYVKCPQLCKNEADGKQKLWRWGVSFKASSGCSEPEGKHIVHHVWMQFEL